MKSEFFQKFESGGNSFLKGGKGPDFVPYMVSCKANAILSSVKVYAHSVVLTVASYVVPVMRIFHSCHLPEIGNFVVASITVDMVNFIKRKCAILKKPGEPMRVMPFSVDANLYVSKALFGSSSRANLVSAVGVSYPYKQTSIPVIRQKFIKFINLNMSGIHAEYCNRVRGCA